MKQDNLSFCIGKKIFNVIIFNRLIILSILSIGSGVMVAAVQRASKRIPIIMGKPEKPMIDSIEAMYVTKLISFALFHGS